MRSGEMLAVTLAAVLTSGNYVAFSARLVLFETSFNSCAPDDARRGNGDAQVMSAPSGLSLGFVAMLTVVPLACSSTTSGSGTSGGARSCADLGTDAQAGKCTTITGDCNAFCRSLASRARPQTPISRAASRRIARLARPNWTAQSSSLRSERKLALAQSLPPLTERA